MANARMNYDVLVELKQRPRGPYPKRYITKTLKEEQYKFYRALKILRLIAVTVKGS